MRFPITLFALSIMAATAASATTRSVEFAPPSDRIGRVYSAGNDAYNIGRGFVFTSLTQQRLDSVALYQDLTGITLDFRVAVAAARSGNVRTETALRSGSRSVTTSGLQFVDFSFAPLTLDAGTYYYVSFFFQGNSNQNFFYDQRGAEPYGEAGFDGIDGLSGDNTQNFVIPRIRFNLSDAAPVVGAVPEPMTWAMMIVGFGIVGATARRQYRATLSHN